MRATAWLLRGYRVLSKGQGPFSRAAKALELQEMNMQSRARVYADVNVTRPREYWDYETLSIQWGCAGPACIGAPRPARRSSACPVASAWTITTVIKRSAWVQLALPLAFGSPGPCRQSILAWIYNQARLLGLVSPLPADSDVMPVYGDQPTPESGLMSGRKALLGLPSSLLPGKPGAGGSL